MFGLPNIYALAASALIAFAGGVWLTSEVYSGKIAKIELAHEKALSVAREEAREDQKKVDQIALEKAVADAEAQEVIITRTHTIKEEVPYYVKDTSTCITVGLVRVLDAAALGADPADLALAPGEFNETCADVTASALARNIAGNYGLFHQNAQQLSSLQDWVRETVKVLE